MNVLKRLKHGGRWSRRNFLKTSAQVVGTVAFAPVAAWAEEAAEEITKRVGPNDRIHVAVMGVHGQGGSHVRQLLKQKDVEITAICDPVGRRAASPRTVAAKRRSRESGRTCRQSRWATLLGSMRPPP